MKKRTIFCSFFENDSHGRIRFMNQKNDFDQLNSASQIAETATPEVPSKDYRNPKLDHLKKNTKTHYTISDEFVFEDWPPPPDPPFLYLSMAGITQPDPKYRVDRTMPTHTTKTLFVLEYVISGQGYISYNGILKKIEAGDFYLLTPGFNGYYYSDPKNPLSKKWINISGELIVSLAKLYGINIQVFVLHHDMEIFFNRIFDLLESYDPKSADDRLKLTHALIDIFDTISRNRKHEKFDALATINDLTNFIEENLTVQKVDIPLLASTFFICERTVHRMFQKEFNMSPNQYITSRKIGLAQKLLLENYPVEKISSMLMFNDPEYFRKVFIKVCGVSPQKYKKQTIK